MIKNLITMITIIVFAAGIASASKLNEKVSTGEIVAITAKPAVVRILDGYVATASWQRANGATKNYSLQIVGSGSGAFADSNGFVITNAHVVDLTFNGEKAAVTQLFDQYANLVAKEYKMSKNDFDDADWDAVRAQFAQTAKLTHIHDVILQNGERFKFEIKSFSAPDTGKDLAVIKIEATNLPMLKLADSESMKLQDHVTVLGYPAAAESNYLDDKSSLQPSITDGKISAKKRLENGTPVFQIDASATHGNSGGPVVNDEGEIIGLLTFRGDRVNGQDIQGFNFVVSSNSVNELLAQAGAKNNGGTNDQKYREGLKYYAEARYRSALEQFEKLESTKQYPELGSLIEECESKKHLETNYLTMLIYAFAAAIFTGVFILAGVLIFVGLRLRPNVPRLNLPDRSEFRPATA